MSGVEEDTFFYFLRHTLNEVMEDSEIMYGSWEGEAGSQQDCY